MNIDDLLKRVERGESAESVVQEQVGPSSRKQEVTSVFIRVNPMDTDEAVEVIREFVGVSPQVKRSGDPASMFGSFDTLVVSAAGARVAKDALRRASIPIIGEVT